MSEDDSFQNLFKSTKFYELWTESIHVVKLAACQFRFFSLLPRVTFLWILMPWLNWEANVNADMFS